MPLTRRATDAAGYDIRLRFSLETSFLVCPKRSRITIYSCSNCDGESTWSGVLHIFVRRSRNSDKLRGKYIKDEPETIADPMT
mmetsp:Transcript_16789/g.49087  ORF Transcript_16789/g.49087 Transcript_16789/m.49087 type:complete len:83 (-) Transcript_16789:286-534(-)